MRPVRDRVHRLNKQNTTVLKSAATSRTARGLAASWLLLLLCASLQPGLATVPRGKVSRDILEKVYFRPGSDRIPKVAHVILNCVVFQLKHFKDIKLAEIQGHTDSRETRKKIALGRRRASAVYHYLIHRGIDPKRLTRRSFGDRKPQRSNATAAGRLANRRVTFKVLRLEHDHTVSP